MRSVQKTRVKLFRLSFSTGSASRNSQSKKPFFDCVRKFDLGFSRKRPFSSDKPDCIRNGLSFSVFLGKNLKFRYKGVEDRAAVPLELCHTRQRTDETEQGRSQGHWQVMADRRRRSELLSSRRRVDIVTAPRRPTERAR